MEKKAVHLNIKKVAIIHDWLNGMRGGEKVLEAILDLFPDADIFTLFLEEAKVSDKINSHRIFSSSLNKKKWIKKRYRTFLPILPLAIESFNMKGYDLIISSSHCVAKGIIPEPDALHISYVHSPMRYIWDQYDEYFGTSKGIKKKIIAYFASKLRIWDVTASARVDRFIANSTFVGKRIEKFYRRTSNVINPPIDTEFFTPKENPQRDSFLTVSALVPYKRVDLLIEAFNISGDKLIIIGQGPEEKKLKAIAKNNIVFVNGISHNELREFFRDAIAFIFAGVEDFGMAFVESLACGTPILAYKRGGVLDIVKDKQTGVLFKNQSVKDIIESIKSIKTMSFDVKTLRNRSLDFSEAKFKENIITLINKEIEKRVIK